MMVLLYKYQCRILLIFFSLYYSFSVSGMEKKAHEALVDEIAENLRVGALTFSSQVPKGLLDHFNHAVDEKVRPFLSNEIYKNSTPIELPVNNEHLEAECHVMTHQERLAYLDCIQNKANTLYKEGKLSSYWLHFFVINVADLLSLDHPLVDTHNRMHPTKTGLNRHLNAATLEETLERFAYLNDHRSEYRSQVVSFMYPPKINVQKSIDGGESWSTPHDWPLEFNFGSFSLDQFQCRDMRWVLYTDCFYISCIVENPYFEFPLLNKSIAHSIALVAVPLVKKSFDGVEKASPGRFGRHDENHGCNLFESHKYLNSLDVQSNPFQKVLFDNWTILPQTSHAAFGYYLIFHEHGYMIRPAYVQDETFNIQQAVEKVSQSIKIEYDQDLSSAEAYVRSSLRSIGIDNPDFLGRIDFDASPIGYKVPGDSEDSLIMTLFGKARLFVCGPYSQVKKELRDQLRYFQKVGAPLDPSMKDDPELGHKYYQYVEQTFQSLVNPQG